MVFIDMRFKKRRAVQSELRYHRRRPNSPPFSSPLEKYEDSKLVWTLEFLSERFSALISFPN